MKVLDIALITALNPNYAMRKAVASLGDEVRVYDWVSDYYKGGAKLINKNILSISDEYSPDLIFMQIQAKNIIHPDTVKKIKERDVCIINWTGDVRQPVPNWYIEIGKIIDLTLFTNVTDIKALRKKNINADYLQVGFENGVFKPKGEKKDYPDIVFLGSNYSTFPLSQERKTMVEMLQKNYKERFGVYGNNWGTEFLPLEEEAICYRSCKIAINQNHYVLPRYSSDRLFRIMGDGAFCLSYHYPDIEHEFKPGKHLDTWKTFNELRIKINYYLKHSEIRINIANAGCELVHKKYTWDKRIKRLKTLISDYELVK